MKMYLETFRVASASDEDGFVLNFPYQLEMGCYSHTNVYPFKIFPQKGLKEIVFAPITLFYGSNGSGKSTLLNVIAEKLRLERSAPFNDTPYFESYLSFCTAETIPEIPKGSKLIASDDVFDLLIELRSINEKIDRRRDALFEEHRALRGEPFLLKTMDDYDEFKRRNVAKRKTKSAYVSERLPKEFVGMSNGESAFAYFTNAIREDALYLLDEPENSLSPKLQIELAEFLESSARFYGCQFVISTHSPFLLSMRGASVYDLDANPISVKKWTELENIRTYYDFFHKHSDEF